MKEKAPILGKGQTELRRLLSQSSASKKGKNRSYPGQRKRT